MGWSRGSAGLPPAEQGWGEPKHDVEIEENGPWATKPCKRPLAKPVRERGKEKEEARHGQKTTGIHAGNNKPMPELWALRSFCFTFM